MGLRGCPQQVACFLPCALTVPLSLHLQALRFRLISNCASVVTFWSDQGRGTFAVDSAPGSVSYVSKMTRRKPRERPFGATPKATPRQLARVRACIARAGSQMALAKLIAVRTGQKASQNLISRTLIAERISDRLAYALTLLFPDLVTL